MGGGNKTPRPKAPGAGKHAKQDTTGAQLGKKKTQQQPLTGQPKPGGGRTSKERTKNGQRKGEAHQNAPGRPARPTWPSRARTRTHEPRHGARCQGPQPNTPARSGGAQPKPEPKHAHPQRAPVPGVAGCKRSTHTAQHPSQEWRGASETRAQTHTPTPRTRGQEWLGASGARTQPNTPARGGGAQPKPEPKHTHPHRAPVPGVARCKQSTHTAQHPSQEWRGAAET